MTNTSSYTLPLNIKLHNTLSNFHDLKIETCSLHGHKHFTVWEWSITYKHAVGSDRRRLSKEEVMPKKLVGCTLMWWDDGVKIVKNHEYVQVKDL